MKIGFCASVSAFSMAINLSAIAQTAPVQADVGGVKSDTNLAEIVVTASRRAESIQKTPTAVSAFGGDSLQQQHLTSLSDIVSISPSIAISNLATNSNITIRGIGNTSYVAGADPAVALHVDGIYLAQPGLALNTFLDVKRVEVLRGPQGTLFGRNATGGVINIIPNQPTDDLHFGVDVSAGLDPVMVRSSAFVSGPITSDGTLQGRISIQQNHNGSHSKLLNASQANGLNSLSNNPAGPRDIDNLTTYSARGQLKWVPSNSFSLRLMVEYQGQNDDGPAIYNVGSPDPTQVPLPRSIANSSFGNISKREVYSNYGQRKLDNYLASLNAEWDLGYGSIKALTSYSKTDQFTQQDGDGSDVDFTHTEFTGRARQTFNELIYTSPSNNAFSFIVGANHFREKFYQLIRVPILELDIGGGTFFGPLTVLNGGTVWTTSYAAFGQAQYQFDFGLKAFGGIRYSHDKKRDAEFNNFKAPFMASQGPKSWSKLTYEAGMSYDLARQVTAYVKYATGYKSGGYSVASFQTPFNPETNRNIEAGIKGVYFGGLLSANLAVFHTTYKDLQVNQVVGVSNGITNAAKAKMEGVEAEISVKPTDALRVNFSASYLDAHFIKFLTTDSARPNTHPDCDIVNGSTVCGIELAGNTLPNAPKYKASIGIFYDVPAPSGQITLGGRYDYTSKRYFNEFNLPVVTQKATGRLDLNATYRSNNGKWSAGVFASNVTNEVIKNGTLVVSAVLGSVSLASLEPGRQVGLSFGYRF